MKATRNTYRDTPKITSPGSVTVTGITLTLSHHNGHPVIWHEGHRGEYQGGRDVDELIAFLTSIRPLLDDQSSEDIRTAH